MSIEDWKQEWEIEGYISLTTIKADSEEEAEEEFFRRNEDVEITKITKCNCSLCSKLSKEES